MVSSERGQNQASILRKLNVNPSHSDVRISGFDLTSHTYGIHTSHVSSPSSEFLRPKLEIPVCGKIKFYADCKKAIR